ncbi:hypothetical protein cyc_08009 [Cyclospora cayetanensis]|uniref:Uncharacterized protein n=1 Tax=Cyclospora cayetanensis TaxID=88456 RepID=A0A1D3D556_9EIME|nr:hypothetical protein cyc_08009 [Cyclospora cayetanensis]
MLIALQSPRRAVSPTLHCSVQLQLHSVWEFCIRPALVLNANAFEERLAPSFTCISAKEASTPSLTAVSTTEGPAALSSDEAPWLLSNCSDVATTDALTPAESTGSSSAAPYRHILTGSAGARTMAETSMPQKSRVVQTSRMRYEQLRREKEAPPKGHMQFQRQGPAGDVQRAPRPAHLKKKDKRKSSKISEAQHDGLRTPAVLKRHGEGSPDPAEELVYTGLICQMRLLLFPQVTFEEKSLQRSQEGSAGAQGNGTRAGNKDQGESE